MKMERQKTRKITRILVEISGIWLWMSFMYLFINIPLYIIDQIIHIPNYIKLPILTLIPVAAIIGYINAHKNYIRTYNLYLKKRSDKQPHNVCIIHISDLHIGSSRTDTTIRQVVENMNKIAQQKNNSENTQTITIISGDIADGSAPVPPDAYKELEKAQMPVIFTPGNHDYYQGIENVKTALKNAGVIILDDKNKIYENLGLNIIGLSFSFDDKNQQYQIPISEELNNILIYHVPDLWDNLSKDGIDLQLSGHTHGGQFYPMNFISEHVFKYNRGLFRNHVKNSDDEYNSYLSVSEGIGTFAAPIRLGTHSEIVVLNIYRI